jgi:hypothetical protein
MLRTEREKTNGFLSIRLRAEIPVTMETSLMILLTK